MIPYVVGKLAPNSSHFTRGSVKYVSGRGYFRTVSSQKGDKIVTAPAPPQSLNGSKCIPNSCNDLINMYQVACYAKIRITKAPDGDH